MITTVEVPKFMNQKQLRQHLKIGHETLLNLESFGLRRIKINNKTILYNLQEVYDVLNKMGEYKF